MRTLNMNLAADNPGLKPASFSINKFLI